MNGLCRETVHETACMIDPTILSQNVLHALAAGITIGCIYGLMCVGLGLIFGIMKVVNFAQGELLMLGMYVVVYLFSSWGLLAFMGPYVGPFAAALMAGPVLFVGGSLLHKFLISRVSGLRTSGSLDDGHFGQLIITLGVSLILQNGGLIVFGSTPVGVRTPLSSRAWEFVPSEAWDISVFFNKARTVSAGVAVRVGALLSLLRESTRLGKSLRAAADNPTAASYMGIDVERAHRTAFGMGAGITA